jgi:hypothetical protein
LLLASLIFAFVQIDNCKGLPEEILAVASASPANSGNSFSVIWITDTQYLSESYPLYYDSLCRWIINNREKYNVQMVIHTGDLVEDEWNTTQWEQANYSISMLQSAGIPYCWDAGNHDFNSTFWIGNQYSAFNPALIAKKPYWIGDEFSGQNTAIHVDIAGWDLVVVNLSYHANESAIDWANQVLDSYQTSHAIVATHAYLNEKGTYTGRGSDESHEAWAENFRNELLDKHSNVFMTLSAHFYPATGSRVRVGDREDLMFNLQDAHGKLGGASLRILTFDPENSKISVKTYVVCANQFLQDQNNQFDVETSFQNTAVPEFPVETVLIAMGVCTVVLFCLRRNLKAISLKNNKN